MRYAIFDKDGNVDCDPEPMIFETRKEAVEALNSDAYDSADGYTVGAVAVTSITTTKPITRNGTSLCINITWEAKELGLGAGDKVGLIISKTEGILGGENIHMYNRQH